MTETGEARAEHDELELLLRKTQALKLFAINSGLDVGHETFERLSKLEDAHANGTLSDHRASLDEATAALTAITYPVTIETIHGDGSHRSPEYERFKSWLGILGLIGVFFSILWFVVRNDGVWANMSDVLSESLLAMSLGLLGAVVYALFNIVRVPGQAFGGEDEYANLARLLLGVLLGWVFYFAFRTEFGNAVEPKPDGDTSLFLLVPFLAGYSTNFAMGVLNKAIMALELTLGLEDPRDKQLADRKRKRPDGSGKTSPNKK